MSGADRDKRPSTLVGPAPDSERRPGLRAVGGAASRIVGPVVARHGGGRLVRLKAQWAAIIGAELAATAWPQSLGRDGALKLLVAPGFALELQHRSALIIERINLFFGGNAVTRLALVQGPLPSIARAREHGQASLSAAETRALDAALDGVSDPELRAALAGLGRAVLSRP